MAGYLDISGSTYSAKDVALVNRMNGLTSHSGAGLFFSSNIGNLLASGINGIGNLASAIKENKDAKNSNEVDSNDQSDNQAKNASDYIKECNLLCDKYQNNPTKANLEKLKDFAEEHKDNKTIQNLYKAVIA